MLPQEKLLKMLRCVMPDTVKVSAITMMGWAVSRLHRPFRTFCKQSNIVADNHGKSSSVCQAQHEVTTKASVFWLLYRLDAFAVTVSSLGGTEVAIMSTLREAFEEQHRSAESQARTSCGCFFGLHTPHSHARQAEVWDYIQTNGHKEAVLLDRAVLNGMPAPRVARPDYRAWV